MSSEHPTGARESSLLTEKMLFTSDDGESLYNIPDNIYIADITEVHFTGLQEGTEVVKRYSVQCET